MHSNRCCVVGWLRLITDHLSNSNSSKNVTTEEVVTVTDNSWKNGDAETLHVQIKEGVKTEVKNVNIFKDRLFRPKTIHSSKFE